MSCVLMAVAGSPVLVAADSAVASAYHLPAGDAAHALKLFSEQSGRGVIAGTDVVRNIRTNPVQGTLTAADALQRMLAGTGLTSVEDRASGAFAVMKAPDAGRRGGRGMQYESGSAAAGPDSGSKPPPALQPMKPSRIFAPLAAIAALFAGSPANAQTTESGAIVGRVFKPETGEYVRNAEVRVTGSAFVTESDESGYYRLDQVPAGPVDVSVKSLGYQPAAARVNVIPGGTVTQDFDIRPLGDRAPGDGVLQLDAFEVVAEREGNAKALQDQKRGMAISNVVGSELFGDTSEGNVGEFLKYLPGVDLDYVQNSARGPRLRGMDARYVGLTLDGMKLSSADAFGLTTGTDNGGTDDSRGFSFESISFSGIDSVEVFKNLTADLDADAPAGSINLRSKRAFDRNGRRISWQATLSANGEEPYRSGYGPFDGKHRRMRPGGMFEYSDQFMGKRLGIVFNVNHSDVFTAQRRTVVQPANRQTTATDQRPAVLNRVEFVDAPATTARTSETFTVDFKATPKLNLGVTTTFSQFEARIDTRQVRFTSSANNTSASGRSTVVGADPMVAFITSANSGSSLSLVGAPNVKLTKSVTIAPRFDYKPTPAWTITGRFGLSKARNDNESLARGVAAGRFGAMTPANSGFIFRLERPDAQSEKFTVTQVAGKDWGDVANFPSPSIGAGERQVLNDVLTGDLSARWDVRRGPLRFIKFGIKSREETTKFMDNRSWNTWTFVGPAGTVNPTWAGYGSDTPFDLGTIGISIRSLSGRTPQYPGRNYTADLFKAHPEYFVHSGATAANYFDSFIEPVRDLKERVDAGYFMGMLQVGRLSVQPGIRAEETNTVTSTFAQRPRAEVIAAGYTVDATGRATTIEGLKYQYETLPKNSLKGDYLNWFPSVILKYDLAENLIAQAGFNKAISRPPLFAISGPVTINDANLTITAPNPTLLPERANTYSARLAYYFEPAGTLSVGVFQNDIENFRGDFEFDDPESIAALGFDPDIYGGYTVRTQRNIPGSRRFRGLEVEYRQSLSFLPGPLSGTYVFASYTRNYADLRRGGLAPHNLSAGTTFSYKRFSANIKAIWTPDVPWTQNNVRRYREERIMTDLGASYQINRRLTISASARNVFNTPTRLLESWPEGNVLHTHAVFGAMWVFSVKGSF